MAAREMALGREPRPSQWAAIRETDRHVLVAAGAGTGKTFTVVGRILYLLGVEVRGQKRESPVRLREIAAITFTNQAAADLKEKLRSGLRAAGRPAEANEVDLARIGTIHGFCGDVLRDFALRAGRAPFREVLDEGAAATLVTDVARETLLDALDRDAVPGLEALLEERSANDVMRWVVGLLNDGSLLDSLRAADLDGHERALVELASRAERRLARRLEAAGAVDFDRMISWTRDLVRDDATVRHALQRRIHTLIIDEFQDVDPIQKELAYLLAEPDGGREDTPRLMLVGDPKQSIYRFRRADVTVWRGVERDFAEGGHGVVVPLEDNFRSVPQVLAAVDATVGRLLDTPLNGQALADYEVPYRPVQATRPAPDSPAVEAILVPPRPANGKVRRSADVRAIEAAAIARRARELHEEGVGWGDMALLLRTWSALDIYRSALVGAGVPVYALHGEGFLETREVMDLIVALEAVRDPRDDRALFGFLRSPHVGVKDETLLRIAHDARRPYWWALRDMAHGRVRDDLSRDAVPDEERDRLLAGVRMLERFVGLRDRLPAGPLLDELLRDSGYTGHLALQGDDGRQRLANVRQFVHMVRGAADGGLGDLLRAIAERRARGDRVAEAPLFGEKDDVLTITSVHSAKGLEWPVVFWGDLVRAPQKSYPDLLTARGEIHLGRPDTHHKEQPQPWQDLLTRIHAEEAAEDRRLWYVAATRAMDRLILSGIPLGTGVRGDPPGTALAGLVPGLLATDASAVSFAGADGRTWPLAVRVAEDEAGAFDAGVEAAEGAGPSQPGPVEDPDILDLPPVPVRVPMGPARHSATEFLVHSRCRRRHWLRYVAGVPEPEHRGSEAALISAVRRGQIVHEVLERLEDEDQLPGLLEVAIGRWDETAPPPDTDPGRRYRAHLRDELQRVLQHPDYRELFDQPAARKELGFAYVHGDGVSALGSIDLAAPGPDGLRMLDVKTTQCDADAVDAKAKQYAPQRDVYVTAAGAIAGQPVDWFAFQFSRAAAHVRQTLDDGARRRARQAFEAAARAVGSGSRDLTEHPEECWFCGYRRVGLCPGVRDPESAGAAAGGDEASP
ncbi:MAG: UvrD-helicase domain-containing protein [Gemmatimonadota bacterium]